MLTIEFVQYHSIKNLSSVTRINKLLRIAKDNKIVLLEGRLSKDEEKELIRVTMEEIDNAFKGIELAVIDPNAENSAFFDKVKTNIANMLIGNRIGLTIIGPATVVKEIKRDPNKIQLLTEELIEKNTKKSSRKRKR